jgi:hypothetical protein
MRLRGQDIDRLRSAGDDLDANHLCDCAVYTAGALRLLGNFLHCSTKHWQSQGIIPQRTVNAGGNFSSIKTVERGEIAPTISALVGGRTFKPLRLRRDR